MEKIFLPYLDTVCDEVTLEFEHESKQDIIKMKPRSAKSPYIKEKIASVNHLFQLQKRWSGQLERYFYTRMQDCEYREITNIGELEKEMQKDFVSFARDGKLAWQDCCGVDTPAKCYDKNFSVIPMVDPEIEKEYDKSEFKRQSFRGFNIVHIG